MLEFPGGGMGGTAACSRVVDQEHALATILTRVNPLPARAVALLDALDAFAARDVFARQPLPAFDNSAMDGYALVASSSEVGARLKIVGEQPAGIDRRLSVGEGEAVRILTGAPMPAGADTVIMQEEARVDGSHIVVNAAPRAGEFVRRAGGYVATGQKIVAVGDRITPTVAALLAAQGMGSVEVGALVRAAVISSGDELVAAGAICRPGQIHDANSTLLQGLLRKCGASVISTVQCADSAAATEDAVRAAAATDVMIITGGVSVGARDFVKGALTAVGATLDLWRVAVKPGKPFLFGRTQSCAIFGLPGNPVSAFVTFMLFVRPALLRMMGASMEALRLPQTQALLAAPVSNDSDRPHYVRGVLRDGTFTPIGRQESHALFGLSRANGMLFVPAGQRIAAGDAGKVLTWE